MSSYVFVSPDHTMVVRDGSSWILWNAVKNQPLSLDCLVGDQWKADGSPIPAAYAAPSLKTTDVDAFVGVRLATGFADAITGKTWQCDDASTNKWVAIAASAGFVITMNVTPAPTFELIAADNTIVELTAVQAFALFNARMMPWVSATILFARTMKNNILADNPPADITIGWP